MILSQESISNEDEEKRYVKLYIVSFGLFSSEDAEYSYSYWDLPIALKTFFTYAAMGWGWISFEVYTLSPEEGEIASGSAFCS